jgi:hypothetical protein
MAATNSEGFNFLGGSRDLAQTAHDPTTFEARRYRQTTWYRHRHTGRAVALAKQGYDFWNEAHKAANGAAITGSDPLDVEYNQRQRRFSTP